LRRAYTHPVDRQKQGAIVILSPPQGQTSDPVNQAGAAAAALQPPLPSRINNVETKPPLKLAAAVAV